MTAAEVFANSRPIAAPPDTVWELPKTAHIIAGLFAITGAGVGAALGWPVGAGVGATLGAAAGYGIYSAAEALATVHGKTGSGPGVGGPASRDLLRRGPNDSPSSLADLYRIRRACL